MAPESPSDCAADPISEIHTPISDAAQIAPYALSEVTVVVAADVKTADTWVALSRLKKRNGDVAAWIGAGAGPGNHALMTAGARRITSVQDIRSSSELQGTSAQHSID